MIKRFLQGATLNMLFSFILTFVKIQFVNKGIKFINLPSILFVYIDLRHMHIQWPFFKFSAIFRKMCALVCGTITFMNNYHYSSIV